MLLGLGRASCQRCPTDLSDWGQMSTCARVACASGTPSARSGMGLALCHPAQEHLHGGVACAVPAQAELPAARIGQ
eukprot:2394997-Alexandrium_andersonii.AAC.1